VPLLAGPPVAIGHEKAVHGTRKRYVQKTAFIINSFALRTTWEVLILGGHHNNRFRGKTLGLVHGENIYFVLLYLLFDIHA
jgi:hypothetical protein